MKPYSWSPVVVALLAFVGGIGTFPGTLSAEPESPAESLGGTVLGPHGTPLEGARVELVPYLDAYRSGLLRLEGIRQKESSSSAVSGPDGRYRLPLHEPGIWKVTVRADGFVPMVLLPVVAGRSKELPPVRLERSESTELRVLARSGDPLTETWVFAEGEVDPRQFPAEGSAWRPDFRFGLTGRGGDISFPRMTGEVLRVTAFPRDAAPESWTVEQAGDLRARSSRGKPIRIRLLDPEGAPVAGALVRVGELLWPVALTDSEGRARVVTGAAGEVRMLFMASNGRRLDTRLPAGTGRESSEPEIELVLPPARELAGKLLDSSTGRPLAGALVWVSSEPGLFTRTDSEGRYRIAIPTEGRFALQAEARGRVPARLSLDPSHVDSGRVPSRSLRTAARVQGRIVDRKGEAIRGASVAAVLRLPGGRRPYFSPDPADSRAEVNAEGRFELAHLLPGSPYELVASAPGFTPSRQEILSPLAESIAAPVRLVLNAERAAVGRVFGPEDRPVAGARVVLRPHALDPKRAGEDEESAPDPFAGETGDEGRFRIARLPGEELDVEIRAEGFAPMIVRRVLVPPGTGTVQLGNFRLVPSVEIAGKIVDPAGEPVAGASIHAFEETLAHWPSRRLDASHGSPDAVSAADGRFRITDLPEDGIRDLLVRAKGFRRAIIPGVEAPAGEPILVALEPASLLAGRVVDEAGEGVAGAHLHLMLRSLLAGVERPIPVGRPFERSFTTREDGSFVVSEIDPGVGHLSVEAHGFITREALPVEVTEGERVEGVEIVLERGATVAGEVLTSEGEPVSGARVTVEGAGGFTDAEGIYRFEGVPLGRGSAAVSHRHYRRKERELEVIPGINTLDWTLPVGQEVEGRVTDPRGEPVASARVNLRTEAKRDGRELRTVTASDGAFRFETVPSDEYRLSAEADGYTRSELGPISVDGTPLDPFELSLRPDAAIAGTIHGLDFDELAAVEVQASRTDTDELRNGTVDWRGEYEIRGLDSGDWLVTASLDRDRRRVEARVPIEPDVEEVRRDLEFTDGPTLAGTVVFAGEPLADATVSIRGVQSALERSVRTGYDGRFEISNLDPGTYWLGVIHRTERVTYNDSVDLLTDREILLDVSTTELLGTVTDAATGAVLTGATVLLRSADGLPGAEGVIAASTDASGTFHVFRVTAGTYTLKVTKDGYRPLERRVDLLAERRESLELELQLTSGLTLQVGMASAIVPPYVKALVTGPGGRSVVSRTRKVEPDGSVHLPTVPPGTWTLFLEAPGAALAELEVVVPSEPVPVFLQPAGTVTVLVPELRSSNQIATLQVFGADGTALRGIDLTVGLRNSWPMTAGRATLEGVPAGVFTFQAQAADGRTWSATVPTETGAAVEVVLQ